MWTVCYRSILEKAQKLEVLRNFYKTMLEFYYVNICWSIIKLGLFCVQPFSKFIFNLVYESIGSWQGIGNGNKPSRTFITQFKTHQSDGLRLPQGAGVKNSVRPSVPLWVIAEIFILLSPTVIFAKSRTQLSYFTFTFHFHALEKEMATHSSVHAWRIPGTGGGGGRGLVGCCLWGRTESDTTEAT